MALHIYLCPSPLLLSLYLSIRQEGIRFLPAKKHLLAEEPRAVVELRRHPMREFGVLRLDRGKLFRVPVG